MKNLSFFVIVAIFISCKKNDNIDTIINNPIDTTHYTYYPDTLVNPAADYVNINCIEQIQPNGGDYDTTRISSVKFSRLQYLIQKNNFNISSDFVINFHEDSTDTYNGKHLLSGISILQFANGLPVFTGNYIYSFIDDSYNFTSGNKNTIQFNTTQNLSLNYLLDLYNYNLSHDPFYKGFADITCITAEFGYYNLNAGISYAPENICKCWKLYPKGAPYIYRYPVLFVNDDTGIKISYFNGIIIG